MASGSFGVSTSNQYISGHIDWSSVPHTDSNSSTVSATLYLSRTNSGYTTSGTGSFTISIDGHQGTNSQSFVFTQNSNTQCVSLTCEVGHRADGSMDINISAWGSMPTFSMSSQGATATLDTIPRASQPTVAYNSYDMGYTNGLLIQTHRASSSFTHTIRYAFGNASGTITTGLATDYYWTVPLDLANQVPNAVSGTGTIYCDTYNGSTFIGTASVNFTVNVPSSLVPSFSSITGSELNGSVSSIIGKYVQKLSNIRLTINGAVGTYSSSITAYTINYNGSNYGSSSIDTGVISWSGNLIVTATITDSRGRTASRTLTLNALAYDYPAVSGFSVTRCNSDGSANDMGTYAKIIVTGSASSLINGTEKNTLTYTLYSKARTTSTWTTIKSATTISGLSLNATNTLGTYAATSSFDFRIDVTDKFNTTISLNALATGIVTMSWSKNGVGIGKVYESGVLDVGGDVNISGSLIIKKVGTTSTITFPAQTNDPGYIQHIESNNIAEMRFCVSDDRDGTDSFTFGSTQGGTWSCCTRIYSNGSIYTDGEIYVGGRNINARVSRLYRHDSEGSFGYYISPWWTANENGWRIGAYNDSADEQANIHRTSVNMADEVWYAGKHPAFTWNGSVNYDTDTYINHNLGYPPIVIFSGTTGNVNPRFVHQSANQILVYNWNSGSNDWSGTIYFF